MNQSQLDQMVSDTEKVLQDVNPLLLKAYKNQEFTEELVQSILDKFQPVYEKYQPGVFGMFSEWFKGILQEDKHIDSSGSYYTALQDKDGIIAIAEANDLEYIHLLDY